MQIGLFQQQSLRLAMSKELSQAISLLQYSSLEVLAFLQEQALHNPLIDFHEPNFSVQQNRQYQAKSSQDYQNIGLKERETLTDHLNLQLMLVKMSEEERICIAYLIQSLDDNGYLTEEVDVIAQALNQQVEVVEKALATIQQLEPAGVGARSLQECLILQLKRKQRLTPEAELVLTQHFEEFAYKKWPQLVKKLHLSLMQLKQIHDDIFVLNPRPGLSYVHDHEKFIIPDFIVKRESNRLAAYANEDIELNVSINNQYEQSLSDQHHPEVVSYLQEKYREIHWIVKGLHTRKKTLKDIMDALLIEQRTFFEKGPHYLKPLTMKELASMIDVHESTISRATKNKYIQTPFGTFDMKYFFTNSIQSTVDADTSATYVKALIQQLVDQEDKKKPRSDQQIVDLLEKDHNIVISRRTVAKYREQLNILSSSKRKTF
ncbi:RNA polymerase factor sigma-54 [Metabacillus iocasae]|uniref:RNA polymerase sigma-54 factor n=1 Tax=Priestia iocasae TaxID=2291674 RepID=A0ABS2QZ98_9BACI|nr:RNA polymerase factor sigma-54 [Metabacillus iocasae]MBM7704523.1 RNA polymerase sigma-54 factor [Metabacillus iocasae]